MNANWIHLSNQFHPVSPAIQVALAVSLFIGSHVLRVQLIRLLLRDYGRPSPTDTLLGYSAAFFANLSMPIRIGDPLRGLFLARSIGTSRSLMVLVVILERFLDAIVLFFLFQFFGTIHLSRFSIVLLILYCVFVVLVVNFFSWRAIDVVHENVHAFLVAHNKLLTARNYWSSVHLIRNYLSSRRYQDLVFALVIALVSALGTILGMSILVPLFSSKYSTSHWLETTLGLYPVIGTLRTWEDMWALLLLPLIPHVFVSLVLVTNRLTGSIQRSNTKQNHSMPKRGRLHHELAGQDITVRLPPLQRRLLNVIQRDHESSKDSFERGGSGAILKTSNLGQIDSSITKYWSISDHQKFMEQVSFMTAHQHRYQFPSILEWGVKRQYLYAKFELLNEYISGHDFVKSASVAELHEFIKQWFVLVTGLQPDEQVNVDMMRQNEIMNWQYKIQSCINSLTRYAPELIDSRGFVFNDGEEQNFFNVHQRVVKSGLLFMGTTRTSIVHGDPTLSNTMVRRSLDGIHVRLIDPNPAQPSIGLEVDCGKMLQSCLARYESLMSVDPSAIQFDGRTLSFRRPTSGSYQLALHMLQDRINDLHPKMYVMSLAQCYIHLLRVFPYRISNDRDRLPLLVLAASEIGEELLRVSNCIR